jgi:hypothetical protein
MPLGSITDTLGDVPVATMPDAPLLRPLTT